MTTARQWAIALAIGALVLVVSFLVMYALYLLGMAYLLPPD